MSAGGTAALRFGNLPVSARESSPAKAAGETTGGGRFKPERQAEQELKFTATAAAAATATATTAAG